MFHYVQHDILLLCVIASEYNAVKNPFFSTKQILHFVQNDNYSLSTINYSLFLGLAKTF